MNEPSNREAVGEKQGGMHRARLGEEVKAKERGGQAETQELVSKKNSQHESEERGCRVHSEVSEVGLDRA